MSAAPATGAPAHAPPARASPHSLGPALAAGVVFVHVPKAGGAPVARALYGAGGVGHRTGRDPREALGAGAGAQAFTSAAEREPAPSNALGAFVLDRLTPQASQSRVHVRPRAGDAAVRQRTGAGGPLPWADAGPPRPAPALSPAARAPRRGLGRRLRPLPLPRP